MPDCYLHVGTHKTGTSAIQAFLLERRDQLLGRGVLVPKAGLPPNGNHLPLVRALCNDPKPPHDASLVADLERELTEYPSHAVLLSSEHMERQFRAGAPSEVVAFFQSRGYATQIICYVRPQHERINSSYAQVVKAFSRNLEFRDFVARTVRARKLEYSRWIRVAEDHGAKLVALPYSRAAQSKGILASFLRVFELEDLAPAPDDFRKNLGVGAAAIAAARTCMDRVSARGLVLAHLQRTRCKKILREADADLPSAPFCGLDADLARFIDDHYRDDNQAFARSVWGASWRDVFGEPDQDVASTEIARDDEASPGYATYLALLDRVWPRVLQIAEDPALKEPTPREAARGQLRG